jgi:valyl-tRNA synthetase
VQILRTPVDIPARCGSAVVTQTIQIHTLVRGLVDLDLEIGKCDKKLKLARLNADKIAKAERQPDYTITVPINVQKANQERVRSLSHCLALFHHVDTPVLAENLPGGDCKS